MNIRYPAATLPLNCTLILLVTATASHAAGQLEACTLTAKAALNACHHDAEDNYWIGIGNCNNLKGPAAVRTECVNDAADTREEERQTCREQFDARLGVCGDLGESRYDPNINPALFVDPKQIGKSVPPNAYLRLIPGRKMIYRNGSERIETTVTRQTVKILGVECAVIHDVARDDGVLTEDTIDWFAQDIYGNVWYFGEISQAFEDGELASLDGSWKAGVAFAKPGIAMKAVPAVGQVYRQEFSLDNAEDLGKVLSLSASAQAPAASCRNNCLLTEDFTPIEPGAHEHKYYLPGVGLLLDFNPDTGEREQLIQIVE